MAMAKGTTVGGSNTDTTTTSPAPPLHPPSGTPAEARRGAGTSAVSDSAAAAAAAALQTQVKALTSELEIMRAKASDQAEAIERLEKQASHSDTGSRTPSETPSGTHPKPTSDSELKRQLKTERKEAAERLSKTRAELEEVIRRAESERDARGRRLRALTENLEKVNEMYNVETKRAGDAVADAKRAREETQRLTRELSLARMQREELQLKSEELEEDILDLKDRLSEADAMAQAAKARLGKARADLISAMPQGEQESAQLAEKNQKLTEALEALRDATTDRIEDLTAELEGAKDELTLLRRGRGEAEKLKKQLAESVEQVKALEAEVEEFGETDAALEHLTTRVSTLEEQLSASRGEAEKLKKIVEANEEMEESHAEMEEELQAEIAEKDAEIANLRSRARADAATGDDQTRTVERYRELTAALQSENAALRARVGHAGDAAREQVLKAQSALRRTERLRSAAARARVRAAAYHAARVRENEAMERARYLHKYLPPGLERCIREFDFLALLERIRFSGVLLGTQLNEHYGIGAVEKHGVDPALARRAYSVAAIAAEAASAAAALSHQIRDLDTKGVRSVGATRTPALRAAEKELNAWLGIVTRDDLSVDTDTKALSAATNTICTLSESLRKAAGPDAAPKPRLALDDIRSEALRAHYTALGACARAKSAESHVRMILADERRRGVSSQGKETAGGQAAEIDPADAAPADAAPADAAHAGPSSSGSSSSEQDLEEAVNTIASAQGAGAATSGLLRTVLSMKPTDMPYFRGKNIPIEAIQSDFKALNNVLEAIASAARAAGSGDDDAESTARFLSAFAEKEPVLRSALVAAQERTGSINRELGVAILAARNAESGSNAKHRSHQQSSGDAASAEDGGSNAPGLVHSRSFMVLEAKTTGGDGFGDSFGSGFDMDGDETESATAPWLLHADRIRADLAAAADRLTELKRIQTSLKETRTALSAAVKEKKTQATKARVLGDQIALLQDQAGNAEALNAEVAKLKDNLRERSETIGRQKSDIEVLSTKQSNMRKKYERLVRQSREEMASRSAGGWRGGAGGTGASIAPEEIRAEMSLLRATIARLQGELNALRWRGTTTTLARDLPPLPLSAGSGSSTGQGVNEERRRVVHELKVLSKSLLGVCAAPKLVDLTTSGAPQKYLSNIMRVRKMGRSARELQRRVAALGESGAALDWTTHVRVPSNPKLVGRVTLPCTPGVRTHEPRRVLLDGRQLAQVLRPVMAGGWSR